MVRWLVVGSFALGLTGACGAPCVDDGLHSKQSGAACIAMTTSGASTTSAPPDTYAATIALTSTGDAASGETTIAVTGASTTTTSSSSTASTSSATSEGSSDSGAPATCDDDVQDPGETGVSCGGVCVVLGPEYKCDLDEGCEVDSDCKSNHCHVTGSCVDVVCDDGLYTPDLEYHIDCGLSCPGCGLGMPCDGSPDACFVGTCLMGTCALDPSCVDGEGPVGDESDVDCGGQLCGPSCKHGKMCNGPADCIAGSCVDGVCDEAHCLNDIQDLGETDIDCGGPCEPCDMGGACVLDFDCYFVACVAEKCGG